MKSLIPSPKDGIALCMPYYGHKTNPGITWEAATKEGEFQRGGGLEAFLETICHNFTSSSLLCFLHCFFLSAELTCHDTLGRRRPGKEETGNSTNECWVEGFGVKLYEGCRETSI